MSESTETGKLFAYTILSFFVTALLVTLGYFWYASTTTPKISGFQDRKIKATEGFAGPVLGAGKPDCMSTSKDCAALYAMLSERTVATEEGPDDLRELQNILSKISCFKRDLLGNAKVVQATRYQPFSTSHDLEPVAETTARCFSKTIPQRDLVLSLDKWGSRGTLLIKRLCTAENLSDSEEKEALRLFGDAMADITNISMGECCSDATPVIGGVNAPRMVGGYTPPKTQGLQEYKGYY
jgi:hypothetical protein